MKNMQIDDFIYYCKKDLGEEKWIPLYQNLKKNDLLGSVFSYLAPKNNKKINSYVEDLSYGSGFPSLIESSESIDYLKNDKNFIPLVIRREAGEKNYNDLLQEMILFLDLHFIVESSKYITYDDNGNEIEVIRVDDKKIDIKINYIEAFLSAKQMDLIITFKKDFKEKLKTKLSENENFKYKEIASYDYKNDQNIYLIKGKKIIRAKERTKENCTPLIKKYESFIVDENKRGESIELSCEKNYNEKTFIAYIVTFKKEVLNKYYEDSDSYFVGDGYLNKGNLWTLNIDNNHKEYINVFLTDLSRIPYEEQKHWKLHNIFVEDNELSPVSFKRWINGEFVCPEETSLLFKERFEEAQNKWFETYGWYLFKPLTDKDGYCFSSLANIIKNGQRAFDIQMLNLAKMTSDSINVKELSKICPPNDSEKGQSMKLLSRYLRENFNSDIVDVLIKTQSLRTGTAHRKGATYENTLKKRNISSNIKEELNIIFKEYVDFFENIIKLLNK